MIDTGNVIHSNMIHSTSYIDVIDPNVKYTQLSVIVNDTEKSTVEDCRTDRGEIRTAVKGP